MAGDRRMTVFGPKVPRVIEFCVRAVSRPDGTVVLHPQVGDPVEVTGHADAMRKIGDLIAAIRGPDVIVAVKLTWENEEAS
jgi:hypothetical protein